MNPWPLPLKEQFLMSLAARKAFLELLSRYTKYSGDWTKCIYCSRLSDCEDHVLPVSVAKSLPLFNWPMGILLIVPACKQCNSIAGARLFTRLSSKKLYIQAALRKRATKLYLHALLEKLGEDQVSMELKSMELKESAGE
jgi:hypothetical protein